MCDLLGKTGVELLELMVTSPCLLVTKLGLEAEYGQKTHLHYFDPLYSLPPSLRKEGLI